MMIADLTAGELADLRLWARTAPAGEAARYGEQALAAARALAEAGLALLVSRRAGGELQRLLVKR